MRQRTRTRNPSFREDKHDLRHSAPKALSSEVNSSPPQSLTPWIILALLSTGSFIFILALRELADNDLGFHLHGGEWILKERRFPLNDEYTYTVSQNPYIDVHWLFQCVHYLIYRVFGFEGLSIASAIWIMSAFLMLFVRMKSEEISLLWSCVFLAFGAGVMELRFSLRPEVWTWVLLLMTIHLLERYQKDKTTRLYGLVLIELIWVNVQGLFILGWIVAGAYFIGDWSRKKTPDLKALMWGIGMVVVTLINPYHIEGTLFPFYLFTRLQKGNPFEGFISELQSPIQVVGGATVDFFASIPIYGFLVLIVFTVIVVLGSLRYRRVEEIIILFSFGYLGLSQIRNMPLFVIIAIPLLAVSLRDMLKHNAPDFLKSNYIGIGVRREGVLSVLLSVVLVLVSLRVLTNAYYESDRRMTRFGVGLDVGAHPVYAAEFIASAPTVMRLINDLNTGSWLGWKSGQSVFIDGRLEVMREAFFAEYRSMFTETGFEHISRRYQPEMVCFDHTASLLWWGFLSKKPDWSMTYCDARYVIFQNSPYPQVNRDSVVKNALSKILTNPDATVTLEELMSYPIPHSITRWVSGFYEKKPYPNALSQAGVFFFRIGEFEAAKRCYMEFITITKGELSEGYFNLASLYYKIGQKKEAKMLYDRYINGGGTHSLAKKRLAE